MKNEKIRKGDMVRLDASRCFTQKAGGSLDYPMTNWLNDNRGTVSASRPITGEETRDWYDSDVSKGMNSAGESKLPPRAVQVLLHRDRIYQVLRARARAMLGWGNPTGGLTKILCTNTGETAYIKRDLLVKI
jgi:hypothetical protein